ncbi:hypothetical protein BKA70DRAFT_1555408 [Coprinopsis sp. MPI-PUGE-AT-0042]|nr:hypothetical protein BKA70DRAFT_1555408 [Coprinopsis sp. MPI-PUGE-AT-0042]
MFQVPHPAHQQYLAAQAEARAAQARADAAKAEYFAQQAILQEEATLKARLYELEQRKRYGSSATHFTPNGYTWPLQPTIDVPSDYSIEFPSFSYTAPHSLGRALPSAHPPYQPYQAPRLDLLLQREQEEQEALEHLRKEKAARLEAERERLRKEQESILAQLAAKKELERKKQEIRAAQAAAHAYYVCDPCTTAHRQGTRLPCSNRTLKATPSQTAAPRGPQPRKREQAAVTTEEDLKAFFATIFGAFAPTHAVTPAPKAHPQPTPPKQQQRSSNIPQSKSNIPPAPKSAASGNSLVDQLKARYQAPGDKEIKDTIFAVVDFLSECPAVKETPKPAPTIAKKPSFETSLVEQLQARSSSQTEGQELRDTIQATINSLLPELNTPPSPSASASSSSRKDKAKATPPATPSVESRLDQVHRIQDEFRKFESEFVFPAQLDFVPTPNPSSTALAHLAFTPRNHPVRFYEQCLASLLVELDSIESQGDATLRSKRKETAGLVEQALETLEQEIMGRWKATKAKEEVATAPTPQTDEAETPASFTIPISDGKSEVVAEDTPVDEELSVSTVNDSALSTADEPLPSSSDEIVSHSEPATLPKVSEEPQLNNSSTADSQLTIKPEEDTPFIPELESSPLPSTTIPSAEIDSEKEIVEGGDSNDGSLPSQTEAEEERPKQKSRKARADDIGSDWSELDA